jgi:Mor family transcriptional regulator
MIKYRRRKVTPDIELRLITDYNSGMPVKDIMERYKISRDTIYRILRKFV